MARNRFGVGDLRVVMAAVRKCGVCGALLAPHDTTPAEMVGRRFGKLTVVQMVADVTPRKWLCSCDCGGSVVVAGDSLRLGRTKKCPACRYKKEASNAGTV